MKFQVNNNILTIGNNSIEFADEIEEVVDFENCLVVRTKRFNSSTLENVYGVNELAKITWQVPLMESIVYQEKEYIGITKPYNRLTKIDDRRIKLHNYDGTTFEVDVTNGKIITNPIESRIGRRPW